MGLETFRRKRRTAELFYPTQAVPVFDRGLEKPPATQEKNYHHLGAVVFTLFNLRQGLGLMTLVTGTRFEVTKEAKEKHEHHQER